MGGCLMGIYASIEAFGFSEDVIGSTRRPTIVNRLSVIALRHIMNPSFVSFDMFALIAPYLFAVLLVHNNDDLIGYQLSGMTHFMPTRLYKSHVLS